MPRKKPAAPPIQTGPLRPLPDPSIPLGSLEEAMCMIECITLALKERNDPHDRVLRQKYVSYAEVVCLEHVSSLLSGVYHEIDLFWGTKTTGFG